MGDVMNKELLRSLPRVDELAEECLEYYNMNFGEDCPLAEPSLFVPYCRVVIDELREGIIGGAAAELPPKSELIESVIAQHNARLEQGLRKVINATGITLHTNLGRAPIGIRAAKAAYEAAVNYTDLEYDIKTGRRGSRYSHAEGLITELTGTEAALVVNNNAAAVMLILHSLGYKKNMVISRGEMVEIGGSFRIPAIMEISGVALKETGCTNRTHLSDYENAIDDDTAAILKVHTSNYVVEGFTSTVSVDELRELADKKNLPIIYDLGSGDLEHIESSADVICFSGDKLLGGPQAGIICGKKKYIDIIKADNLNRTIRPDKMTLAALSETLKDRLYRGEESPVSRLLGMTIDEMDKKADIFIEKFNECCRKEAGAGMIVTLEKVETVTETGGGSRPGILMPELCLGVSSERMGAEEISRAFRLNPAVPIIGRIKDDEFLISMRTVGVEEFDEVINALRYVRRQIENSVGGISHI